jgi:hypothetical protein
LTTLDGTPINSGDEIVRKLSLRKGPHGENEERRRSERQ